MWKQALLQKEEQEEKKEDTETNKEESKEVKEDNNEEIKEKAYKANMILYKLGIAPFTWGNASECDREKRVFAIKPSGVEYEALTPDMMVIVDFDGNYNTCELNSYVKVHGLEKAKEELETAQNAISILGGNNVKTDEIIKFQMEGEDREVIRENVVDMCERLLCNPVIHDYKINVIPQNMACGK